MRSLHTMTYYSPHVAYYSIFFMAVFCQSKASNKDNVYDILDILFCKKYYFPMQKFAKIFPNNSSFVTCPVIIPK